MQMENNAQELTGIKKYFKEQNIEFSFNRIAIQGLGGMAHGLFASLLIGTIIKTVGGFIPGSVGAFLLEVAGYTTSVQGAAMALAIGYAMSCPPYVLYSLATVGFAANALGGGGGPLAVYAISLVAILCGKLVSKRTPVDLIVTPTVTILVGVLLAKFLAPPIGEIAVILGDVIMWATNQQPFLMGVLVSVLMGIVLTLPISSAAICAALGIVGLAGGAAVAGCCAQMVGFAVCTYRENKMGGLTAIGLGTSMLLVPNLLKKPILWLPPTLAAAITGPIATCVFGLTMNGASVSAGMGTCGLVGPIGVVTGWLTPSEKAVEMGMTAIAPGAMDWIGMLLICFVLPAILSFVISEFMRKKGWIQEGDYKLV
ncbi:MULTISPECIES: PTS transporter subunit IIC [Anaerotruncus]|uniref:PTS sugar transporter subunit IIC n=1 Tax=Anaerotruncus colihominis TaxID=169435 RepID=A0A845RQS0_9FIRM|nr:MULTISPECIES: PTS sugar transporter subunit IIC [Anaerotruncus]MCR2025633.1 PTS sugar transporter subunit IIC [Anaerotruncus colihominis]NBI79962.1 PTS sugar transporter subunit IIC [Anaerotruncus colihominis]NDO39656.1 PTS sugar transporter subunit IIC [Anaerotruncus colihominis]